MLRVKIRLVIMQMDEQVFMMMFISSVFENECIILLLKKNSVSNIRVVVKEVLMVWFSILLMVLLMIFFGLVFRVLWKFLCIWLVIMMELLSEQLIRVRIVVSMVRLKCYCSRENRFSMMIMLCSSVVMVVILNLLVNWNYM